MNLDDFGHKVELYPAELSDEYQGTVSLPSFLFRDGKYFVMTVDGNGFSESGIHTGDYIFFRVQNTAAPGDLVLVMLDGTPTMRRYYPEDGHVRLCTEDKRPAIVLDSCTILAVAAKALIDLNAEENE